MKTSQTTSKKRREWTPDEVALTIWAHHQIVASPVERSAILKDLAAELHRNRDAVEAAVEAVPSVGGPSDAKLLRLLTGRATSGENLLTDFPFCKRIVQVIRARRQQSVP